MPARSPGEPGATYHAVTPDAVLTHVIPSSGVTYWVRCRKLRQANTTAASVSSARVTAPRRNRRRSFIQPPVPFIILVQHAGFQRIINYGNVKSSIGSMLQSCNVRAVRRIPFVGGAFPIPVTKIQSKNG